MFLITGCEIFSTDALCTISIWAKYLNAYDRDSNYDMFQAPANLFCIFKRKRYRQKSSNRCGNPAYQLTCIVLETNIFRGGFFPSWDTVYVLSTHPSYTLSLFRVVRVLTTGDKFRRKLTVSFGAQLLNKQLLQHKNRGFLENGMECSAPQNDRRI